ncbi:MAG: AIR synthase-related protein, partial [Streptosporangiaceae bacterium]
AVTPAARAAWLASALRAVPEDLAVLLYDAQTSGGLLLATPVASTGALLADLRARGLPAAPIGEVTAGPPGHIEVRP